MFHHEQYKKTRRQAFEAGDEFYYPGVKCKNGGVSLRKTKDYKCICEFCTQKARDHASDYQSRNRSAASERHRRWAEKNKDYVKQKMRKHYEQNKEKIKRRSAKWYNENRDRAIDSRANYYARNKDRLNEKGRKYHWENRDRIIKRRKNYRIKNKELILYHNSKRRAETAKRVAPWFGELDELVMKEAHHLARQRSESTGIPWAVDHRVPLMGATFSGLHCALNIQVIPSSINNSKGNRLMYVEDLEWLRHYDEA